MNATAAWILGLVMVIAYGLPGVEESVAAETRVSQDADQDGVTDRVLVTDEQGNLVRLEMYHQWPGSPSAVQYYTRQALTRAEKDTNRDGKFDIVIFHETPDRILERQDTDMDGVFDLETWYEGGKRVMLKQDLNADGRMERVTGFDALGEVAKITVDTNADGRVDEWQTFRRDCLEHVEKDRNHDQQVDLKMFYIEGEKQRLIKDENHDGHFEISQWFDRSPWVAVVEADDDANGTPESVLFYTLEGLRQKDHDTDQDGRVDFREHVDARGRVVKTEEYAGSAADFNRIWLYDEAGNPSRAETDTNGDGRSDVWYYYHGGRLTSVREDANHDGRPDLWEEYGPTGTIIRQSRDLNRDGVPDMTRDYQEPGPQGAAAGNGPVGKE